MPIHGRIVATYPAEFGDPEERFDLTYVLRPEFAPDSLEAHKQIISSLKSEEVLSLPTTDALLPARFEAHVVEEVWVW